MGSEQEKKRRIFFASQALLFIRYNLNTHALAVPFLNEPRIIIFINSMNRIGANPKAKRQDVDTNIICYIYNARYFYFMVHLTWLLHMCKKVKKKVMCESGCERVRAQSSAPAHARTS